jgi:hypothetical protein
MTMSDPHTKPTTTMSDLSTLWRKHRHIAPPGILGVTTSACTSTGFASIPAWLCDIKHKGKDARDVINEANVITKASHLIPASKQKWKDMDKLDVLEKAVKRTEEAANAAEGGERDAAVAAGEMDGESGLAAQITGNMADMSVQVDTSIEQTVEYRHLYSADAQIYGTTTIIWDPLGNTLARDLKVDANITRGTRDRENNMDAAASDSVDDSLFPPSLPGLRVQQASSHSIRPH